MIPSIDERLSIESQVEELLHLEIARGHFREGEPLPSPQTVAKTLVVNPRKVERAYLALCRDGLATQPDGIPHYLVADGARERGRQRLIETAKRDLTAMRTQLKKAGLSGNEIDTVFNEAIVSSKGDNLKDD
jgi:DNA-binding transcriptional regulator YhcF (GntR family)